MILRTVYAIYSMHIAACLKNIEWHLEPKHNPVTSKPAGAVSNIYSNTSVKLPKLQLAKFSGGRMEFQGFWDMFGTAVLSNDTLSV